MARRHLPIAAFWLLPVCLQAKTMPMRTYATTEGLETGRVGNLVRDAQGYLWVCSPEGVSRFDGYRFVNYTVGDAPPARGIYCIHDVNGIYWIDNTEGGLYRYVPAHAPSLSAPGPASARAGRSRLPVDVITTAHVTACEACRRDFWVASIPSAKEQPAELFRMDGVTLAPVDLHLPPEVRPGFTVDVIDEGKDGSVWLGTARGLLRRLPDGAVVQYNFQRAGARGVDAPEFHNLVEATDGRLWIGYRDSLYHFTPEPLSAFAGAGSFVSRVVAARAPPVDGLAPPAGEATDWSAAVQAVAAAARTAPAPRGDPPRIGAVYQQRGGALWVTCRDQLLRFDGAAFQLYSELPIRNKRMVWSILADDAGGGLWVGGRNALLRLSLQGATHDAADGLAPTGVDSLHAAADALYAVNGDEPSFTRIIGSHYARTPFDVPAPLDAALLDHTGGWWLAAKGNVHRMTTPAGHGPLRPAHVYSRGSELPGEARSLFEDAHGDVWIGTQAPAALVRWVRAAGRFEVVGAPGVFQPDEFVMAFVQDRDGALWLGLSKGGLLRYSDGRLTAVPWPGAPGPPLSSLFFDRAGGLWLASYGGGLWRLDDPHGAPGRAVRYTTAEGLSSNYANALVDDAYGRLYVGTANGVDRLVLVPDTHAIVGYGLADGWTHEFVSAVLRDAAGVLWFGKPTGLVELHPAPEQAAPSTRIVGLRISGDRDTVRSLDLGQRRTAVPDLAHDQNGVELAFSSIGHGELVRYQYKLQDTDAEWKTTSERTITYARLAPGRYHFQVRALGSDGRPGQADEIHFRILEPIWRRPWFLAAAALASGLLIAAVYRMRAARLIEVERMRTRIATDLHDDVGSSLSLIAILSEVVRRELDPGAAASRTLSDIAATSRELVDSLSDIVWAINPHRDRASDLSYKMRRFASDSLTPRNIQLVFEAREPAAPVALGPDVRRQVFLVFKEAVNNLVRHAECTRARVELAVDHATVRLAVEDDGRGFATGPASSGHGLMSMQRRARELWATLAVTSEVGRGTRIALEVPLRPRWRARRSAAPPPAPPDPAT
jgi:signal transduction histidine kinase/ligand-binding sensor domain-containing protein